MESNSFYPDLDQLARATNDQTVGISLRIKDSTRSLFELEAQKRHTSISAIINSLLDEYAKQYILQNYQQKAINAQTIRRYVETATRKASTLDTETLLRDTMENYHPEALFELNHNIESLILQKPDGTLQFTTDTSHAVSDDELIRDFTMWANGQPTHFFAQNPPYIYFADGVITALPPHAHASVKLITNGTVNTSYLELYLPAPKWLIAITIISAFLQKNTELNSDYRQFGETTCRNIAQLANATEDYTAFAENISALVLQSLVSEQRSNLNRTTRTTSPTWTFIIVLALERIGGKGSLSEIYSACHKVALELNKVPTKHFEATIRGELENHSRDSKKFNGKWNYFSNPENGSGIWLLNPGVHADLENMAIVVPE